MIIVTGAGGFIGSNIVAELAEIGDGPVVVCDHWGTGEKWRNVAKHFVADFVRPDQLLSYLRQVGSEVRGVVHTA